MSAFILAVPRGRSVVDIGAARAVLVAGGGSGPTVAPRSLDSRWQPAAVSRTDSAGDRTDNAGDDTGGHAAIPVWVSGAASAWRGTDGAAVACCGAPERVIRAPESPWRAQFTDAAEIGRAWRAGDVAVLDELLGPHAVAVWDAGRARLHLQVDALNTESLFLRVTDAALYACTEVAPLLALPGHTAFDQSALTDILAFRFLAGTRTCWEGVRQVTPGRRCVVQLDGTVHEEPSPMIRYGAADPSWQLANATDALDRALQANLERLRDSGVSNVAVFLSGGIDSSVLAALARRIFPRCTGVTFRVDGYENPELARSQLVAERLGMPLHLARVQASDVVRLHPWIIGRIQEPPLHYNNPIVARMLEETRDIAPVVISGDLAGMYSMGLGLSNRLQREAALTWRLSLLPAPLRHTMARLLRGTGMPRLSRVANLMDHSRERLVQYLRGQTLRPEAARALPAHARTGAPSHDFVERVYDATLPIEEAAHVWVERVMEGAILRRNTRLSAPFGIRFHYPFLDVGAMELVKALPRTLRYDPRTNANKPLLRALCDRHVGADVSAWPKLGLPSPEREWMEGPLREHLDASMADDSLLGAFVDVRAMRALSLERNQSTFWTLMTLHEVLRQGEALMCAQE